MTWESTALRTFFDVVVIAAAFASVWILFAHRDIRVKHDTNYSSVLIMLGLLTVGLFYLADLIIMFGLPLYIPRPAATAMMHDLHLNYGRLVQFVAVGCVFGGFALMHRRLFLLIGRMPRSEADHGRELPERKQSEEALVERTRRLEGLIRTSATLAETIEANETLSVIAAEAANLLGVEGAGFRLLEGNRLVVRGSFGLAGKVMLKPVIAIGDSLSGRVAQEGRAVAVSDLREEPRYDAEHQQGAVAHGLVAYLGVPLRYRESIIGVLNVYAAKPHAFSAEEISLLQAFADQAASAIAKTRLYEEARRQAEELQKEVAERIQAQERLQFLADHDILTQLPNRTLFIDRLNQLLARARWHDRVVSVLFFDLDRFKNINDTLGHDAGDCLLQRVAERLRGGVRDGDTVARFGGDEFAILLQDMADAKDIAPITRKILDSLSAPFKIAEHELFVTASIGVSTYPNDGLDSSALLKHADTAMYRAKEQGGNSHQFYSPEMSALARDRLRLETSLRHALERQEFLLHYQPLVESRTGLVAGMEALIRWDHPDSGLIPPLEFIPVLEETGLMVAVGEWVLRRACRECQRFTEAAQRTLSLAVNVSSRQFRQQDLVEVVANALQDARMEPRRLQLEITESVLMDDPESAAASLRALRDLGVRVALDDFGTGYSSLSYLRQFPIDTVKVDRSFVRDIAHDTEDAALVSAIIQMCHTLNLPVIAEGVETQAQLGLLQEQGCHLMQGYLFSKPLPVEGMIQYLENRKPPQRKRQSQRLSHPTPSISP